MTELKNCQVKNGYGRHITTNIGCKFVKENFSECNPFPWRLLCDCSIVETTGHYLINSEEEMPPTASFENPQQNKFGLYPGRRWGGGGGGGLYGWPPRICFLQIEPRLSIAWQRFVSLRKPNRCSRSHLFSLEVSIIAWSFISLLGISILPEKLVRAELVLGKNKYVLKISDVTTFFISQKIWRYYFVHFISMNNFANTRQIESLSVIHGKRTKKPL